MTEPFSSEVTYEGETWVLIEPSERDLVWPGRERWEAELGVPEELTMSYFYLEVRSATLCLVGVGYTSRQGWPTTAGPLPVRRDSLDLPIEYTGALVLAESVLARERLVLSFEAGRLDRVESVERSPLALSFSQRDKT